MAGFPDHKHAYAWPGWEVLTDAEGVTYGPGSLCVDKVLMPRDGLIVEPNSKATGRLYCVTIPATRTAT